MQVLQSSKSTDTDTPTSEKPLHNPYKSKKWYLSMHRLAHSLTNQSCGLLLIWNGTLFSKMAPWCGQVRGHSIFDHKFFPIPGGLLQWAITVPAGTFRYSFEAVLIFFFNFKLFKHYILH
jgi:hypothetical protein